MLRRVSLIPLAIFVAIPVQGQTTTTTAIAPRDAAALAVVGQPLRDLTGGTAINDLTLQGSDTYTADSDGATCPISLLANGNLQSCLSLSLPGGQRTEIRTGPVDDWIGTDGVEHGERRVNVNRLAEQIGVSRYRFKRLLRQQTGFMFKGKLRESRLAKSKTLVANPRLTIEQVALCSGYWSVPTFTRNFKQRFSMSPVSIAVAHPGKN